MFPFEQFDVGRDPDDDSSFKSFAKVEGGVVAAQTQFSALEDFGKLGEKSDLYSSGFGFYQDEVADEQQVQMISDFEGLDGVCLDVLAQPSQLWFEDITEVASFNSENSEVIQPEEKEVPSYNFQSLGILKDVTRRSRYMNGKRINVPSYGRAYTKSSDPKSTVGIISLAGEKFIQCVSQRIDDVSFLSNPFACSFMGLSDDESRDVELVVDLLACAEKVGQQQFDSARKLITQCDKLSSNSGNPVQRLAYYFCEALQERINQEKGEVKHNGSGKMQLVDLRESLMSASPSVIALHQRIPFSQVCQFTAIQAIADNMRRVRNFHIIDMEIRNGVQHTVLIQELAARAESFFQHLKITAIGTSSKSKIEETGKRLRSVAHSMNVPLTFNVVMVADMLDLNIDLLQLDDEEDVAIYSGYFLETLILHQDHLDHLMTVFRNINPCTIVLSQTEANQNSPAFVNRFIETLFYYAAIFDALAECMSDLESDRRVLEADFGLMIKNVVAAEGTERIVRHISLDVWRTYFARFGLVEADLSSTSEYQADLLVKNFKCGSSCSLVMDGKCLVVGWKGTPIYSVSAWKFL